MDLSQTAWGPILAAPFTNYVTFPLLYHPTPYLILHFCKMGIIIIIATRRVTVGLKKITHVRLSA